MIAEHLLSSVHDDFIAQSGEDGEIGALGWKTLGGVSFITGLAYHPGILRVSTPVNQIGLSVS